MEAKQLAVYQLQTEGLKFPKYTRFITLLKSMDQLYYLTVNCCVLYTSNQALLSHPNPCVFGGYRSNRCSGIVSQARLWALKVFVNTSGPCETSEQNYYGSQTLKADKNLQSQHGFICEKSNTSIQLLENKTTSLEFLAKITRYYLTFGPRSPF